MNIFQQINSGATAFSLLTRVQEHHPQLKFHMKNELSHQLRSDSPSIFEVGCQSSSSMGLPPHGDWKNFRSLHAVAAPRRTESEAQLDLFTCP